MPKKTLLSLLLIGGLSAKAAVNVAATTSNMGMLVRTIGGDSVKVTVLAPPDRDPHFLQAKPSMMMALRNADLLVSVGAELEQGWLPAAVQGASNPKILVGQPGYFEACAQVPLIDKADASDRSRGDVHPMGNPHVFLDPERMSEIGRALAGRLARLYPAGEARFRESAEQFAKRAAERVAQWKKTAAGAPGALLYHKDSNYLLALLGVPILGYVEPLPGIPPTAEHLSGLVGQLKGRRGVVLYTDYQSSQGPAFLARALGWPQSRLAPEVALNGDASAYFEMIDRWVNGVASGK